MGGGSSIGGGRRNGRALSAVYYRQDGFAAFRSVQISRSLSCTNCDGGGRLRWAGARVPARLPSRRWARALGAPVSLAEIFATGDAPEFERLLEVEKIPDCLRESICSA